MRMGCALSAGLVFVLVLVLICGGCGVGSQTETKAPSANTVAVTFQPNNGDATVVLNVEKGALIQGAPVPEKRACEFIGWYLNEETPWDLSADTVEETMMLTAKWKLAADAYERDPNAGTRAEGTQIRIMSYNVRIPIGDNMPISPERDVGVLHTTQAYLPDVLALQEFPIEWNYAFRNVFADTDYRLVSGDNPTINGLEANCNLAYNTKVLNLVEFDSFGYMVTDSPKARVLTWALFETKDASKQRFLVTTTHWSLTEEMRVLQGKELAKWILKTQEKYKVPIIAVGDYNSYEGDGSYVALVGGASLQDAKYTAAKRGLVGLTHYSGVKYFDDKVNVYACIDHILHTSDVEVLYYDTVIDMETLKSSDHNPVYADIKFPPAG